MPANEMKTSPILILVNLLLIGILTGLLTGSSGASTALAPSSADVIVANNPHSIETIGSLLMTPTPSPVPETEPAAEPASRSETETEGNAPDSDEQTQTQSQADTAAAGSQDSSRLPQASPYEPSPESKEGE